MTNALHDTFEMKVSRDDVRVSLADVIDNAADQDRATVLTENGKPVAAVVPIDVLEFYERSLPL
jgi:prevent-host-death family protein